MNDYSQEALDIHEKFHGKIHIGLNDNLKSLDKLKLYYTPGVAAVSLKIAAQPESLNRYTWTSNNVAVISDGSAVLGLGNIGPAAALPVMEGKSLLFKHFAGINAVPIVIDVHTTEEIIAVVKAIAPGFGGINLEDIAAPQCFAIEQKLAEELPIPVFHDDQHGTAIVALAGLINSCRLTGRDLNHSRIVLSGAGAAGIAIAKLIHKYAPEAQITAVDSKGVIASSRQDLNPSKLELLALSSPSVKHGTLSDAVKGADIFIGVSAPRTLEPSMVKTMNEKPIIFAMANPEPEIQPDAARSAGAAIVATGRSDYPNQINNALAFPGIFRGVLDNHVRHITDRHKLQAAQAIAALVDHPSADKIIPQLDDPRLVEAVAAVIR